MKKILLAAAALCCAMTLTVLTACTNDNDDNPTPNPSKGDGFVHITMQLADYGDFDELAGDSIDNPDNASAATVRAATRAIVSTETGGVKFVNGDVVLVANAGRYIGSMTYRDGLLEGDIFEPSTEDYLHLYFLGNKQPADLIPGETTSCAVDISDQSKQLPILCYGASLTKYTTPDVNYICLLNNKCSIMEFDLVSPSKDGGTLSEMQVCANVDFANPDNAITTADSTGTIQLFASDEKTRYAVLLPQKAVDNATVTVNGAHYTVNIREIKANYIYGGSDAYRIRNEVAFSIGPNRKVVFAPGNLQVHYVSGGNLYRFAPTHYSLISYYVHWYDTPGEWRDLFTNGAWNECCGNVGDTSGWRLLSTEEMNYILGDSEARRGKHIWGETNGVWGMALIPDNYDGPEINQDVWTHHIGTPGFGAETEESCWSRLAEAGVVFLPAAEFWGKASTLDPPHNYGTKCIYWLSDCRYVMGEDGCYIYTPTFTDYTSGQAFVRFVKDLP